MNDYNAEISRQTKIVNEAEDAMHAALEAAVASKRNKNAALSDRVDRCKEQLAALETLIGSKASELAEEVAKGDTTAAKKLEEEIAVLSAQAEDTRRKIVAIGGVTVKADPELVLAAIRAYAKASGAKASANIGLHRTADRVKAQIQKLNQLYVEIEKQARILSGRYSGIAASGIDRDADTLIRLYEECIGEIDVAGHTCGTATEAKFRFIKGNSRGLEHTAAAKALADLQPGQI